MVYPHLYRTEHCETKTTNSNYGEYHAQSKSRKIPIQPPLLEILQYVDSNRQNFVDNLAKLIEIQSVNADISVRSELTSIVKAIEAWLIKLGCKYEVFNIGYMEKDGKQIKLPPIVLATLGRNPRKRTICVYGHLDIKRPNRADWYTEPFQLTREQKYLYGSGVASGKGPLLCWFHTIQAFQENNLEIPVNVKFLIESMFNEDSEGLAYFLALRKADFFFDVENIVINQGEWLGLKRPCLIYGTVGIIHYSLTIEKTENSKGDLRQDMENLCNEICDDKGNILIPNFHQIVKQITPEEEKIYEAITDFDIKAVRVGLQPHQKTWSKEKLLMYFWRLPSMWFGEIEECICDKKDTSKIKRHIISKIVPSQITERSASLMTQHVRNCVKKLKIEHQVECETLSGTKPWLQDVNSAPYEAARKADIQIFKEDPNLIRMDSDRVVITTIEHVLEKPVIVMPICMRGANADKANENISEKNFFEASKLFAAYLFQISYQ